MWETAHGTSAEVAIGIVGPGRSATVFALIPFLLAGGRAWR